MTLPTMGRKYQIDYLSGIRYVFSPVYRAQVRLTWGRNSLLKVLYLLGAIIGVAVLISALLLLAFAILGLLR